MKIIPLAFDSFGARSMATYIETRDIKILIDPGVSLGPKRYGLPPHKKEIEREGELWEDLKDKAKISDLLIVTHYHYDHHDPSYPELYKDKILFIKDPKNNINYSQKNRAKYFLEQIKDIPKEINITDNSSFEYKNTKIVFSKPVCHGTNNKLGYVVETLIDDGKERFIHTSDVEGPALDDQVEFILEHNPKTLILDGPMSYLLGYVYPSKYLEKSIENIIKIIDETEIRTIIPDHHFTRDLHYVERLKDVYERIEGTDVKVITAAEYAGRDVELLEARRKELYAKSS
jgi:predicted metallo-beta-lactamase superfamily hydrolase